jgi:integrase
MARPIKQRDMWRIRWIDAAGKRRSEVYSKLKDAERALRARELDAEEVRLGVRKPVLADKTFGDLADCWLRTRAVAKRSKKDDESILRAHLLPAFGTLLLHQINVEHIELFRASKADKADKTVANFLTLLKTMLNYAVELGWLAKVPPVRKPKVPLFPSDFRYLRNHDEVAVFLRAAAAEGELVYTLYAVAIYTGMRAGEIAGLRWRHIDFDRRLITVEMSYDGDTKSRRVRHVPLLDPLMPILQRWKLMHPGDLVFTNETGEMYGESARIFQEVLHRVLDRAQLPPIKTKGGKTLRYIVFHSLRHTFASLWVASGGDLFRLQKILGHSTTTMTQRYAHLAPALYADDHGRLGTRAPRLEDATVLRLRTRNVQREASSPGSEVKSRRAALARA